MLRKFVEGLVFGTGVAIAFIIVAMIWLNAFQPMQVHRLDNVAHDDEAPATVMTAPPVSNQRYLGSSGLYAGEFRHQRDAVLASGEGRIIGAVSDGARPVAGLRLRLALNGSVMSQWAVSDDHGRYQVPLPYGEYRLDGFELDTDSANRVLVGKISHPRFPSLGGMVTVARGKPGEGFALRFVDPVEIAGPRGEISIKGEVVARWKPVPGALTYAVQVSESATPDDYPRKRLFEWNERPRLLEPSINLTRQGVQFKPNHYYQLTITAEDDSGLPISETAESANRFDFKVVE